MLASMQNVEILFFTFCVDKLNIDIKCRNVEKNSISVCGCTMSPHLWDVLFLVIVFCLSVCIRKISVSRTHQLQIKNIL